MSVTLQVNYATRTQSGFINKKEDLQVVPSYLIREIYKEVKVEPKGGY